MTHITISCTTDDLVQIADLFTRYRSHAKGWLVWTAEARKAGSTKEWERAHFKAREHGDAMFKIGVALTTYEGITVDTLDDIVDDIDTTEIYEVA